jgi:hypothetical protein
LKNHYLLDQTNISDHSDSRFRIPRKDGGPEGRETFNDLGINRRKIVNGHQYPDALKKKSERIENHVDGF